MIRINYLLKLIEVKLVAILKATISLGISLNGVVGQMDVLVFTVVESIFEAAGSKIAFFVEEDLEFLVDEDPDANIKLPLVY